MKKLTIPALVQRCRGADPSTLAAVIAQHSPPVRAFEKRVIVRLLRGSTSFGFPPVDAHSVVYRVSNVHITSRNCDLSFGSRKRTLTGREVNELGATTAVPGIPPRKPQAQAPKASPIAARSTRRSCGGRRCGLFRDGAVDVFVAFEAQSPLWLNCVR
jgi:hypothetical protein